MELKLSVEQYAKINEMGFTAEQVQDLVNLIIPEAPEQPDPEPVKIPDYSDSFTAISAQLEALTKKIEKTSIINSGTDDNKPVENDIIKFLNENL